MAILTEDQKNTFWRDGVLTVENAVTSDQLKSLRVQFADWVEESRNHTDPYGDSLDGRPRFDMQPGHTAETPTLRRVNAPTEVSEIYLEVMGNSAMTDMVAELIGPNIKSHHTKINSKLPGSATEVKWHQDFPFTPHSNSDMITALLMIDEVTLENGPLEVAKESHKGDLHSLWHDGVFTGAIDETIAEDMKANSTKCYGPAGSVCLMHTKVAHGSAPNLSKHPRTLFICVYSAADALPLTPNPVPNKHQGLIVRGTDPNQIRCTEYKVEIPQFPKSTSFFSQQAKVDGN